LLTMGLFDLYCLLACTVCVAGLGSKLVRLCAAVRLTPSLPSPTPDPKAPAVGLAKTLVRSLTGPFRSFCARANPCWTVGCFAYHMAIVTVAVGYALSLGLLAIRLGHGQSLPDVLSGQPTPDAWHPSNILALIFGNSEPAAARFLFGRGHRAFVVATHAEVVFAVAGNLCLLCTLCRRQMGAVLHDLDPAASSLRRAGRFSTEHMVVRALVFLIIQAELVARLRLWPQVVYIHVFLAASFLALLPFSYLAHIFYTPVALVLGYHRRRDRVTA